MAEIEEIDSMESWHEIWEAQKTDAATVLIFKKSPICPTSFAAENEFNDFVQSLPASTPLRILSVDVVNQRSVSRQIADDTGIRHESPQALLIATGRKVLWNESHREITRTSLAKATKGAGKNSLS